MRSFVAVAATVMLLLLCSSVALAGWSAPRVLSLSHYSPYAHTDVAVDARGDAAVAWERVGSRPVESHGRRCSPAPTRASCFPVSSVYLSVLTTDGRLVTRALWSSRINPTIDLSVVVSGGSVTLAWDYSNASSTLHTLRVAYGPLIGRWAPSRAIWSFSGLGPFAGDPHLAAAPNGEVLVAWTVCTSRDCGYNESRYGVAVRWRAPGRGFGAPQLLRDAPLYAVPQFDSRGTAYLHSYCSGRVLIAPAHSQRFSRTVMLTPGPALAMNLSLDGAGQGLAAWVAGACSNDEAESNTPGPVFVSLLRGGTFAKPQALTPHSTQAISGSAVAVPGGGTVSWYVVAANGAPEPFSFQIGANGLPGATQQGANAVIAVTADGRGDVVLEGGRAANTYGPGAPGPGPLANTLFLRPVGGGPDQPAPSPSGEAAAAPFGRAVALTWYNGPTTLELSVWRP